MTLDPHLQEALEKLAAALHAAIESSDDVEESLAAIKRDGFQAMLLLEVTVAFGPAPAIEAPAEESQQLVLPEMPEHEGEPDPTAPEWVVEMGGGAETTEAPKPDDLATRIAPDDREFLKSLRIRLEG